MFEKYSKFFVKAIQAIRVLRIYSNISITLPAQLKHAEGSQPWAVNGLSHCPGNAEEEE